MTTECSSAYQRKCHPEDPRYNIDHARKVFVYKNLHKGCWSIKQDGLVKMHITDLCMYDCSFRVNKKGREKVLKEKRKNVHAGIVGYIDTHWDVEGSGTLSRRLARFANSTKLAMYNPYKHKSFVRVDDDSKPVFWSSSVRMETPKERGDKDKVEYIPCIDSANRI